MRGKNESYLKNENGKVISHIAGIFYKTSNYLAVNITPIYVFDGKPPQNKDDTIKSRHDKVKNAKEAMENNTLSEQEKNKLEKQTVRLTKEYVDDIKYLLTLMGVSYVQADGEAEAYASEMCRKGIVDYVVTEDMDTLAFGCPKMIRTCLDKSIKRSDIISIIDLETILSKFEMNYVEFVDMCILCGCDYCSSLPRVGNKTAFNHIKNFKNIEAMLPKVKELPDGLETFVSENSGNISGGQKQRIGLARAIYSNPKFLLLDEATSALDSISEKEILKSIFNINNIKNIVLISHKYENFNLCNKVFKISQNNLKKLND